jgi:hypothetical protein
VSLCSNQENFITIELNELGASPNTLSSAEQATTTKRPSFRTTADAIALDSPAASNTFTNSSSSAAAPSASSCTPHDSVAFIEQSALEAFHHIPSLNANEDQRMLTLQVPASNTYTHRLLCCHISPLPNTAAVFTKHEAV